MKFIEEISAGFAQCDEVEFVNIKIDYKLLHIDMIQELDFKINGQFFMRADANHAKSHVIIRDVPRQFDYAIRMIAYSRDEFPDEAGFKLSSTATSVESVVMPAKAERKFAEGDFVRKTKGSSWHGRVVGFYSTELTPIGYCVESVREPGSVQVYPEAALEYDR